MEFEADAICGTVSSLIGGLQVPKHWGHFLSSFSWLCLVWDTLPLGCLEHATPGKKPLFSWSEGHLCCSVSIGLYVATHWEWGSVQWSRGCKRGGTMGSGKGSIVSVPTTKPEFH